MPPLDIFSGWVDDASAVRPPPPPPGFAGYQPVPDGTSAQLAPNQIYQSQYDDLKKFDFDKFDVVPDDFKGKMLPTQMRASQYDDLQAAWLNIEQGNGMRMSGAPADQDAFRSMLRNGMNDSPTLRGLITSIGNDADQSHLIDADLGRGGQDPAFQGVILDDFGTNQIDLDDLEQLPGSPSELHPDEYSRPECITHFLAERQWALDNPDNAGNPSLHFAKAHDVATDVQNQYRDERAQSHVLSMTSVSYPGGGKTATVALNTGSAEALSIDPSGQIAGVSPP